MGGKDMEKRILTAALLSFVFMMWYASLVSKRMPRAAPQAPSSASPVASEEARPSEMSASHAKSYLLEAEDVIFIESERLLLEVGKKSAALRVVTLKEYQDLKSDRPLAFGGTTPILAILVNGQAISADIVRASQQLVEWRATDAEGQTYSLSMKLEPGTSVVQLDMSRIGASISTTAPATFELVRTWQKGDALADRYNPLEVVLLAEKERPWQRRYPRYMGRQRTERVVPRGTSFSTLCDRYFCQALKTDSDRALVTLIPTPEETIGAVVSIGGGADPQAGATGFSAELYLGPRDYATLRQAEFQAALPLGVLGRIGLVLLMVLSWIAKVVHNYGVGIILFSVLITCVLAPFTLLSFKSMKKMQQLKPQIDVLMAKYKGDPQRANREVFALYKEQKVSPVSGCLPMLLQFPVLIALFQGISHFIELRGQSFLWIADLSLPDRLAELPFALPLLGRDVNALPIIMAGAMFVQTKTSQKQMSGAESNPMAKMMSGPLMSVIFGVMFYQFPAGLVLYWLTNSLMSIVWYRVAK